MIYFNTIWTSQINIKSGWWGLLHDEQQVFSNILMIGEINWSMSPNSPNRKLKWFRTWFTSHENGSTFISLYQLTHCGQDQLQFDNELGRWEAVSEMSPLGNFSIKLSTPKMLMFCFTAVDANLFLDSWESAGAQAKILVFLLTYSIV